MFTSDSIMSNRRPARIVATAANPSFAVSTWCSESSTWLTTALRSSSSSMISMRAMAEERFAGPGVPVGHDGFSRNRRCPTPFTRVKGKRTENSMRTRLIDMGLCAGLLLSSGVALADPAPAKAPETQNDKADQQFLEAALGVNE